MPEIKKFLNPAIHTSQRLFLPVHFFRPILTLLFLAAIVFQTAAQDQPTRRKGSRIIDDTTKQVYGPKTSRYYYEQDFFYNRTVFSTIDTAIRNFHRWTYVQQNHYFYQDLGNIGTSMKSIFFKPPTLIGATSGFTSYDVYWDAEKIRYFDTKSPYSNMRVNLGGKGRSTTKITFSRNIKPNWNIGFNFRALLIDKQIQRASKGDRNVKATYYDLYTTYETPDSSYRLFLNFQRAKHDADEYGGVLQPPGVNFKYGDYFSTDAQPNLHEAISEDLRMNIHLYHQYKVGSALQLYHIFDRYRQGNNFVDVVASEPDGYYGSFVNIVADSTNDYAKFKALRNEVGIKGNLLKLFYNGYYALRNVSYTNRGGEFIQNDYKASESYIGGRMSLALDSIGELGGWVEVQQNGNYRVEGTLKSKWFEASLKQMQYSPSYLTQSYVGMYNVWTNNFNSTNMTQVNGYIHYKTPTFTVSPGLTFTTLNNYVYFKEVPEASDTVQKVMPYQTSDGQVIVSPEVKVSLVLARHIHFDAQFMYTRVLKNADDAIQLPAVFVNSQLSYENIFFNGNLDMHGGVDFHFQSDYLANSYWVPTQQFYTQRSFTSPSFPLIDLFFSARIKRGRVFLKYNNLIQAFTKEGYMATPQYPGQRPILDFGFDWSFYD
ncbi:Putative porin [Chryseolinea serpens]|uniref:Putative porin n=1 Tax=Chryseolinea serpens TaxID=947013 RepID=A0A1M5VTD8_9BACT|nr:putative porin [Chryseolinea serpens]SHH78264.1 Putative porin [Chryseolinea serpens]